MGIENTGLQSGKFNVQNNLPCTNTVTTGSVQIKTDNLKHSPNVDTVSLSNMRPMSKQTKTALTIGGLATAVLGSVLSVKGFRSYKISKSLSQIEQKFLKLQEKIPQVQKTFQKVFLRTDISEKETLEMLNRYKDVEKISVTGTKEEYIQAVFNEAKRNFGFKDSKIKLALQNGQVSKNGKTNGGAAQLCNRIDVDPDSKIEKIEGIIHHEMRHIKQSFFAANYDPQTYKSALRSDDTAKLLSKKQLDEVLDDCMKNILEVFNLNSFSRDNIPKEYLKYAQQCLNGCKTYVDGHRDFNSYYNNFKEVDARYAGGLIDKLFQGAILGGNR